MSSAPANWYPDSTGRHELRYWDGTRWTEHVSDQGVTGVDALHGAASAPVERGLDRLDSVLTVGKQDDPAKIRDQVHGDGTGTRRSANVGAAAFAGDGSVFGEPILVVNQKAKIIELKNEYGVFDQAGQRIAGVTEIGQGKAKKALRLLTSLDQFMTHRLEITDNVGNVVLRVTRPAKVMKSTVIVSDANDQEIGRVVQDNVFGKIHFTLEAGGQTQGAIKAENWRAWNFRIEDATGAEVARITKTFEGIAKTLFTTADNYVVQIHRPLAQPLSSLVVAAALSVDTALKQDSRGLG